MKLSIISLNYILLALAAVSEIFASSRMEMNIQPKDSQKIEERIVTSDLFSTRADSGSTYFLIFFDKDPQSCDQEAYINIAAPSKESLKLGRYDNIQGNDDVSRTGPLLDFYYTEPNGLRYHCIDSIQTGFFEINELEFNREGEVSKLAFKFEIHCLIKGKSEKRAASGNLVYSEVSGKMLKFLE